MRIERGAYKIHTGESPNLLLGMIYDGYGRPMTIADGVTNGSRYRYYISNTPKWAREPPVRRIRANADTDGPRHDRRVPNRSVPPRVYR